MERHEYRLGDVCTLRAGSAFNKKYQGLPDGDLPFIKVSDMNLPANQFRIHEANNWVSHATAQDIGARSFPAGTVVFAKIGEALKQNRVRLLTVPTLIDNNMMGAIPNPDLVDPYYLMLALAFAGLDRWATGTAMPYLTQGTLNEVPIELPDLRMQRKVAAVVAAYDELIENNLRRIEILEEMAQAVYREWFVNFRFPGHENVAFVDSPLGPIPEGWRVAAIKDICSRIQAGSTPLRSNLDFWDESGVAWYKTGELQDGFLLDSEEHVAIDAPIRMFDPGTILMAIYGSPTVGRMGIVVEPSSANQAALGLVPDLDQVGPILLFHLLLDRRAHFNSIAQGAAQQNISKAKVESTGVVLPEIQVASAFEDTVEPHWGLRLNLARQNANLRTTRDLLLPKLVSGEIDVSDLDIDTEWLAS